MPGLPAMVDNQLTINLLGSKQKKLAEQFLEWALAIGRLLVIITETVALAAFLYRFSIDRQLIDLNDEIKKNQNIVLYFKQGETTYRHIQQKLNIAKREHDGSKPLIQLFSQLIQMGNEYGVTFNSLTVNNSSLAMTAKSGSIENLSSFFNEIKKNPIFTSISVDKVETKTDSALIIIGITAKMKTEPEQL